MMALLFLAQWAIRSAVLIFCGAGLVWIFRVKNAFVRLAAWSALLAGSFAIPALTLTLPMIPIAIPRAEPVIGPQAVSVTVQSLPNMPLPELAHTADRPFDWAQTALLVYAAIVLLLLLRVLIGVVLGRRLLRDARATERTFRESNRVAAPVVLGILRPVLVLPRDWREWERTKLNAVLAHERSHIRRYDPAVQILSAIHRAVLWVSPASWLLHTLIVRTAEEASDAAAVGEIGDRAFYAEILLGFMQRGIRRANWLGVPMARYGWADRRIHRILAGTALPAITRWTLAAIMAMVSALACLIAMAHLSQGAPRIPGRIASLATAPASPGKGPQPLYMSTIGTVTATTVDVMTPIDGQLTSAGCVDGRPVKAGQPLAMIESSKAGQGPAHTQIRAPISGLAGFCKVNPGNFVHPGETLLTITQLRPIAVLFSIPQEYVPRLRALLANGSALAVGVYDRGGRTRLATGRVTAMNNAIDPATGTVGLRASFENRNGALFPNAYVILRLPVGARESKRH
jgi:beta-lactamase regulating signal transducer with metallopeptidase domain